MRSRFLKIFIVTLSVACLVLSWCSTFAFAVDPVSAGFALASAVDAYGMAYGVGTVYDVTNQAGVSSSFSGLWDDFSQYQSNNGDNFDYSTFYDNFDSDPSIQAYSHSSGKFAAWVIDDESAEVFDKFWNWLLTGPAEMVRVDNQFQFSQSQIGVNASPIPVIDLSVAPLLPIITSWQVDATTFNAAKPIFTSFLQNGYMHYNLFTSTSEPAPYVFCFYSSSDSNLVVAFDGNAGYSVAANRFIEYATSSNRYYDETFNISSGSSYDYTYNFKYKTKTLTGNYSVHVPIYSTITDGFSALRGGITNGFDSDTIGVKAYTDTGIVSIPDVFDPDYVPQAIEIVTNVPWDESIDDTDEDQNGLPIPFPPSSVTPVVDDMIDLIIDDGFAITVDPNPNPDPDPSPGEVFLPFLPVGLPSFNFSFSGIWHYVREWVSSLGAWFTTLFTIWSALPYAMVVPVYATAVVVIVLGVYKRFFM